jgi:hypothetical protein
MEKYLLLSAAVAACFLTYRIVIYFKGRRGRLLADLAGKRSVRLETFGPEIAMLEATGLPFFVDGRGGVGRFLMQLPEEDGARSFYFDYSCLLGSGNEQRRRQSTVALFEFQKGAFPDFHLSCGGELANETSGLEPAEMSGFKGFPEGVKLFGRDQDALKRFFNQEIAACFGEHPGWSVQGSGRWLVLYRGCALAAPGNYPSFMTESAKLAFNLA